MSSSKKRKFEDIHAVENYLPENADTMNVDNSIRNENINNITPIIDIEQDEDELEETEKDNMCVDDGDVEDDDSKLPQSKSKKRLDPSMLAKYEKKLHEYYENKTVGYFDSNNFGGGGTNRTFSVYEHTDISLICSEYHSLETERRQQDINIHSERIGAYLLNFKPDDIEWVERNKVILAKLVMGEISNYAVFNHVLRVESIENILIPLIAKRELVWDSDFQTISKKSEQNHVDALEDFIVTSCDIDIYSLISTMSNVFIVTFLSVYIAHTHRARIVFHLNEMDYVIVICIRPSVFYKKSFDPLYVGKWITSKTFYTYLNMKNMENIGKMELDLATNSFGTIIEQLVSTKWSFDNYYFEKYSLMNPSDKQSHVFRKM